MTRRAPLWLAAPSRFAGASPRRARLFLLLFAALLAIALSSLVTPGPPPISSGGTNVAEDRADEILYESITDAVRQGTDYYTAAAAALRAGGYPMRPFVTFRMPTLAALQARMSQHAAVILLYALALLTLIAWWRRLGEATSRFPPRAIATLLAAAGMAGPVHGELFAFHEVWATLLVALSLATRRPGHWVTAAAIGLCAMLIRETAAIYVGVMALLAFLEGERREAAGWVAVTAVFAVAVVFHAQAVAGVVRPFDQASQGWSGMLGPGFAIKAIVLTTPLGLGSPLLGALAVAVAIAGWAAWRDPLATRALATTLAYLALLAIFCRTDTFYWAFFVSPIVLIGIAFAPDGLRDLIRAALDRRRITVTRIAR